jgi:SAM-dependent methyltransferase
MIPRVSLLLSLAASSCSRTPRSAEADVPAPRVPASTAAQAASPSADPSATAQADASAADEDEQLPDIEYVPTPANVVERMLAVAKLSKDDVLYDLGCGDGRIVVTAAKKYGLRARGFDVDPARVKESRDNVAKAGVQDRVTIEKRDIFTVDLSGATVVTLYLLPELNVRLIPQLEKLRPGARIVSHDFDMEGITPERVWTVMAPDHRPPHADREHYVYLWKTPLRRAKKR